MVGTTPDDFGMRSSKASRWQPFVEGSAILHASWRSSVVRSEGLNVSPERVGIDPLFPVGELQQAPGTGGGDAVLRGQARRAAIVSDKKAREPTSRDDRD